MAVLALKGVLDNGRHLVELGAEVVHAIVIGEAQRRRGHPHVILAYETGTHCKRRLWIGKEFKVKTLLGRCGHR